MLLRQLARAAAGIFLAAAAFLAVRLLVLYRNSVALGQISKAFPREYKVGDPGPGENPPLLLYVVMGDSISQGTGVQRVQDSLPFQVAEHVAHQTGRQIQILNLAKTGAQVEDMERRQLPELRYLTDTPALITVTIGANDATHGTPHDQYVASLTHICRALAATGAKQIIIASSPDLGPVPILLPYVGGQMAKRSAQQNAALSRIAAPLNIQIADFYRRGKLYGQPVYAADDFHPDAKGYKKWAQLFIEQLR